MNNEKRAKDYITEGLFQLMERKDYNKITITDITNRAGVNRVTFYRNFSSKEEVIKSYLEQSFKEWGSIWEASGDTNIQRQIFRYFDENRRVILLLYKADLQHFLAQNILIACGYNKEEENVISYMKSFVAYGIFGWCNEWYLRGMHESLDDMVKLLEEFDKQNKK